MPVDQNSPEIGNQALGQAYNKLLQENAVLRIQGESKDIVIRRQESLIVELEKIAPKPKADPNRATRRKTAAAAAKKEGK